MTLEKTTKEDISKINSEICQIINQRYLLTTFAITTFGIIIAWLIPKTSEGAGANPPIFYYAGSILLLFILFALYLFNYCLKGMVRIFSTYLQAAEASGWEKNWQAYRDKNSFKYSYFKYSNYWGYTKAQTVIFLVLGFLAFLFPISIIHFSETLTFQTSNEFWFHLILSMIYMISIFLTGFLGILDPEKKAMDRWNEIKNPPPINRNS